MIMLLAKIPIPFIVYSHPAPWLFLIVSAIVVGLLVRQLAGSGEVDPTIGWPAGLFVYSGYHMVGGMFNGFDPSFLLGLLGTLGSGAFGVALVKKMHSDHAQMLADEPQRQAQLRADGIRNLMSNLNVSETEAIELMDRYHNDDTKAILEARAGRLSVGDKPAQPAAVATSSSPGVSVEKISGTPFDQANGYTLLQASPGEKDYSKWSKMLASVCELLPIDAMQKLRAHRGAVIIPNLREEVADAFMKLLEQEGVDVLKMPVSKMMKFSSCGQLKTLSFEGNTVTLTNHSEDSFTVPSEQLLLLTVGLFGATGITGPDGMVEASKGHMGADLFVLEDDVCYQFALDQTRLTYAHLGDKMASNGFENFKLTIADLVEKVPTLQTNESVASLIEKGRARHFRTSEDYGGEVTGLAQLIQATRLLRG